EKVEVTVERIPSPGARKTTMVPWAGSATATSRYPSPSKSPTAAVGDSELGSRGDSRGMANEIAGQVVHCAGRGADQPSITQKAASVRDRRLREPPLSASAKRG